LAKRWSPQNLSSCHEEGRIVNLLGLFKNAKDVKAYGAGEAVFTEGQPRDVMYVVPEGEVDILKHGRSLYTAGPGELLGEMALIDSKGRSASAVALSHCRLASVDERQFLFMVQETPASRYTSCRCSSRGFAC
jgi:CRP/FNR family cyclic AMP-dependent transcriptional regulator